MITEQARMPVIVVQLVHKDPFEHYSKSGEECTEFVVFQQCQRAKPCKKPHITNIDVCHNMVIMAGAICSEWMLVGLHYRLQGNYPEFLCLINLPYLFQGRECFYSAYDTIPSSTPGLSNDSKPIFNDTDISIDLSRQTWQTHYKKPDGQICSFDELIILHFLRVEEWN